MANKLFQRLVETTEQSGKNIAEISKTLLALSKSDDKGASGIQSELAKQGKMTNLRLDKILDVDEHIKSELTKQGKMTTLRLDKILDVGEHINSELAKQGKMTTLRLDKILDANESTKSEIAKQGKMTTLRLDKIVDASNSAKEEIAKQGKETADRLDKVVDTNESTKNEVAKQGKLTSDYLGQIRDIDKSAKEEIAKQGKETADRLDKVIQNGVNFAKHASFKQGSTGPSASSASASLKNMTGVSASTGGVIGELQKQTSLIGAQTKVLSEQNSLLSVIAAFLQKTPTAEDHEKWNREGRTKPKAEKEKEKADDDSGWSWLLASLAALVAGLNYMSGKWEKLLNILPESIRSAIQSSADFVKDKTNTWIDKANKGWSDIFTAAGISVDRWWHDRVSRLKQAFEDSFFGEIGNKIKHTFSEWSAYFEKLPSGFKKTWEDLKDVAQLVYNIIPEEDRNRISKYAKSLRDDIKSVFHEVGIQLNYVKLGVDSWIEDFKKKHPEMGKWVDKTTAAAKGIASKTNKQFESHNDKWDMIKQTVKGFWTGKRVATDELRDEHNKVVDRLNEAFPNLRELEPDKRQTLGEMFREELDGGPLDPHQYQEFLRTQKKLSDVLDKALPGLESSTWMSPSPIKPEPVKSEPVKVEPAKTEPAKPEPDKPLGKVVPYIEKSSPNKVQVNFEQNAPNLLRNLMRDYGLSQTQAAGIVGNLAHESAGLQAGIQEHGVERGGIGWAQWTGKRRDAFEAYLKKTGQEATDPNANYGFLKKELASKAYRDIIKQIKQASTIEEATRIWHDTYERSADVKDGEIVKPKQYYNREKYAKQAADINLDIEDTKPVDEAASATTKSGKDKVIAEDKIVVASLGPVDLSGLRPVEPTRSEPSDSSRPVIITYDAEGNPHEIVSAETQPKSPVPGEADPKATKVRSEDQGQLILRSAEAMLGMGERKNRDALVNFLNEHSGTTFKSISGAINAWCARYVSSVLESRGIQSPKTASAADYMDYGESVWDRKKQTGELSDVKPGDIALFNRKGGSGKHVAFVKSVDLDSGVVTIVGGNQGDRVSEETRSVRNLAAVRRAPEASTELDTTVAKAIKAGFSSVVGKDLVNPSIRDAISETYDFVSGVSSEIMTQSEKALTEPQQAINRAFDQPTPSPAIPAEWRIMPGSPGLGLKRPIWDTIIENTGRVGDSIRGILGDVTSTVRNFPGSVTGPINRQIGPIFPEDTATPESVTKENPYPTSTPELKSDIILNESLSRLGVTPWSKPEAKYGEVGFKSAVEKATETSSQRDEDDYGQRVGNVAGGQDPWLSLSGIPMTPMDLLLARTNVGETT